MGWGVFLGREGVKKIFSAVGTAFEVKEKDLNGALVGRREEWREGGWELRIGGLRDTEKGPSIGRAQLMCAQILRSKSLNPSIPRSLPPFPYPTQTAVTGLSGSGPAYVFMFIEALADGGVRAGLPRNIAMQLATQTVKGAASMLQQTGEHPGVLKDQVASPGGTTIAGIEALEKGAFRATVMGAVTAAADRSKQLAELSKPTPNPRPPAT